MSINKNIPQVEALKKDVEKKLGYKLTTHYQFVELMHLIEEELHEHISETTLERVWNYSTRHYDNISLRTLDVLCRFVEGSDWDKYCDNIRKRWKRESGLFEDEAINVCNLRPGCRIKIAWLPDRVCQICYIGNYLFEVLDSKNSSISPGDTFNCFLLQKGRPMYMDNFRRRDEKEYVVSGARYAVGQDNGLTALEILE